MNCAKYGNINNISIGYIYQLYGVIINYYVNTLSAMAKYHLRHDSVMEMIYYGKYHLRHDLMTVTEMIFLM